MEQTKPSQSLPDNAYCELKPGEEYVPMMPADAKPKGGHSLFGYDGPADGRLFSAAAAYLGLRIGQVFEAAIPIAIIAVGVGNMLGKKNHAGTERHHTVESAPRRASSSPERSSPCRRSTSSVWKPHSTKYSSRRYWAVSWASCCSSPSANISSRRCTASTPSRRRRPRPKCSYRAKKAAIRPSCWP